MSSGRASGDAPTVCDFKRRPFGQMNDLNQFKLVQKNVQRLPVQCRSGGHTDIQRIDFTIRRHSCYGQRSIPVGLQQQQCYVWRDESNDNHHHTQSHKN